MYNEDKNKSKKCAWWIVIECHLFKWYKVMKLLYRQDHFSDFSQRHNYSQTLVSVYTMSFLIKTEIWFVFVTCCYVSNMYWKEMWQSAAYRTSSVLNLYQDTYCRCEGKYCVNLTANSGIPIRRRGTPFVSFYLWHLVLDTGWPPHMTNQVLKRPIALSTRKHFSLHILLVFVLVCVKGDRTRNLCVVSQVFYHWAKYLYYLHTLHRETD